MSIARVGVLLAAMAVVGCASTSLKRESFKSYQVGAVSTVPAGEKILVDQTGYVETVRTWVGLLHSPDGWSTQDRYSRDWVRKELLYSGRSGSVIEVAYREFRGGYAAPAFYQHLKYDLAESTGIRFQNFKIDVLEASNERIKFKILSD